MGFMNRLNTSLLGDFNKTRKSAKRVYKKLNKNKDFKFAKGLVYSSVKNTIKREMKRAKSSGKSSIGFPSDVNRMTDF